jgi:hypothetical protein
MLAVAYATGRASHARQFKGDDPDKKGYPGPPGWGGLAWGSQPHTVKKLIVTKVEQRKSWMDLTMMERVGDGGKKMEGSCSTGQSPQWAVVPVEEEGELILSNTNCNKSCVTVKRYVIIILCNTTCVCL